MLAAHLALAIVAFPGDVDLNVSAEGLTAVVGRVSLQAHQPLSASPTLSSIRITADVHKASTDNLTRALALASFAHWRPEDGALILGRTPADFLALSKARAKAREQFAEQY